MSTEEIVESVKREWRIWTNQGERGVWREQDKRHSHYCCCWVRRVAWVLAAASAHSVVVAAIAGQEVAAS